VLLKWQCILLYCICHKIMIYSGVKDVPRVSQNVCRSLSLLKHNISLTITLEPCRQRTRELSINTAVAQLLWKRKKKKNIMATLSAKKTTTMKTKNATIKDNYLIFLRIYILPHHINILFIFPKSLILLLESRLSPKKLWNP